MIIELYIFAFIIIVYGLFITIAIFGFNNHTNIDIHDTHTHYTNFSVIIPARNEAQHIQTCVQQIVAQEYPTQYFEIIIIDDSSEDETYNLAKEVLSQSGISYQIIKQTQHLGKKHNIAQAIQVAKGDVIVTTDADVTFRNIFWLKALHQYFTKHSPDLLIMPVDYHSNSQLLGVFQIVENLALTGFSVGFAGVKKPFLCSGANLAFRKESFNRVGRYQSHQHISSGEDVFLLEDIKHLPNTTIMYGLSPYLIVRTNPEKTLSDFCQQRIRWAYKAKYNKNQLNLFLGLIIVLANLLLPALLVAFTKQSVIMPYLSIFVLTKFVFDFLLLFLASNFLGRVKYLWWLIPFELVYWIYTLIIGATSLFYKPYWKGKKIH